MKIKNLFILSSLALIAASCSESQDVEKPSPKVGEEVKFGAALDANSLTRTVYGDRSDESFAINWKNGDEVYIFSPTDGMERDSATYKVSVANDGNQNYADDIVKKGGAGVSWGTNLTGDFYSIYPSNPNISFDETIVTLTMPSEQHQIVTTQSDGTTLDNPDMDACFMYAKRTGVTSGETVNLVYSPLSTSIRFTLQGSENSEEMTIQKVVLHAADDVALAGDFTVDLSGDKPTVTAAGNNTNEITIYSVNEASSYITIGQNEEVDINAFVIPLSDVKITDKWYIEVTANNKVYKKSLTASTNAIEPSQIHIIGKLPALTGEDWDVSRWITYLDPQTYLSELSIPGSWNSCNKDFQPGDNGARSLEEQYNAGARAFHFDVRWRASKTSGSGLTEHATEAGELALAIGDGYSINWNRATNADEKLATSNVSTFEDYLTQVCNVVKNDAYNQYAVVFCTLANASYAGTNKDGKTWMQAISDACDDINSSITSKDGKPIILDATSLNSESVVNDVLDHVIVIVNCESNPASLTLPTSSKCLFVNVPNTLVETDYTGQSYFTKAMYKGDNSTVGLTLHATQAQVTAEGEETVTGYSTYYKNWLGVVRDRGYAPSLIQRKTQAENILAYHNTNDNDHSIWMYLGLGGIMYDTECKPVNGSVSTVGNYFNNWLNEKLDEMKSSSVYPLGIVLMNDVYNYSETLKEIILINNKRKLDKKETTTVSLTSAAKGYNSGMHDNKVNAISWTSGK